MSLKRYTSFQELKKELKQENRQMTKQFGQHANLVRQQEFQREERDQDRSKHSVNNNTLKSGRTWTDDQLIALGAILQRERRSNGVSQPKIGTLLKMESSKISNIENGKFKGIDKALVEAYCHHAAIDMEEVLLEVERRDVMRPVNGSGFQRKRTNIEVFEGEDFSIIADIGVEGFSIKMKTKDMMEIEVYKGRKYKNNPFFEAMKEAIKTIEKSI